MASTNGSTNGNGSRILFYFLVAFLSIFLVGGGYSLYRGVTAYLGGVPITSPDVLVFLIVGGLFVAVPVFFLISTLRSENLPAPPEEAPWTVRPAWQTKELTEDRSSEGRTTTWAVLWNLVTWPLAVIILREAIWQPPEPEWAALLILIFPAVGIGFAWSALKRVLHRWKYGTSTLRMETMPGRLGRRLRARLRAPLAPDEAPEDGFHVQLSCYRRYVDHTGEGSTVRRDLKWRDEKHLRGQPSSEKEGVTEVPLSFELPSDQPSSTPHKTKERMLWEVSVSADVPGLDYESAFEIPVFEPDDQSSSSGEGTEPSRSQTGEGVEASPQPEQTAEAASDPYAEHEVGEDFTEPVSDGVRMEGRPGRGLSFSFAPARAWGPALGLTAIGLPCLVGGVYALTVSFFLALFLFLFGAVFGYVAWRKWTLASTLSVDDGRVELTKSALGKEATTTRLRCEDLEDVLVEAQNEAFGATYYALKLLVHPDAEARSGSKSGTRSGSQSQQSGASGGPEQPAGSEVQEEGSVQERELTVAKDLTNKQEADWIADRILQAAEREASFHSGRAG